MLNSKELNMTELFKNTFKVFMQKLADENNISLDELVRLSNNDAQLRNEIEQKFLLAIK
jgi:hypothetical protein